MQGDDVSADLLEVAKYLIAPLLVGIGIACANWQLAMHTRRKELARQQLQHFYGPLHMHLRTNQRLFEVYGPRNAPGTEEAAATWNSCVDQVILPNNAAMLDIILQQGHWRVIDDRSTLYQDLCVHIVSYRHFREAPESSTGRHRFPVDIVPHVEKYINTLLNVAR